MKSILILMWKFVLINLSDSPKINPFQNCGAIGGSQRSVEEKFHKGLGTSACLIYKMAELSFASTSGLEAHTVPLKER